MSSPLEISVKRRPYNERPAHHVVAAKAAGWTTSLMPSWNATSQDSKDTGSGASSKPPQSRTSTDSLKKLGRNRTLTRKRSSEAQQTISFRNPWPSWHKPSNLEIWRALEWGEDTDPCIEIARSHATAPGKSVESIKKQASQLLHLTKPDFSFDMSTQAKTTWLGHAGVLVQLPTKGSRPVRCLFDPMFSMRCSPTQTAGPLRTYPPPCKVGDLPDIDVVMISHSHFDHLDYDTIMELWTRNTKTIRFLVPLGNRPWFIECGISADQVTELDWWDTATLKASEAAATENPSTTITCTPSQHNSGRSPADANTTLWSSWYVDHSPKEGDSYRVFFAGDTGYQFHDSPGWPPLPPLSVAERKQVAPRIDDDSLQAKHPVCPAFGEIVARLGPPHLLILPIAVGATYDYLRSMAPVPDSVNPIPRHSPGVTAHNHMPPWDAVRVLNLMTKDNKTDERPVAVAMHFGTFMSDPVDVLKTLGQLEWACEAHGVRFARTLEKGADEKSVFLALNHGESVTT